ncbi:uncharacterized protein [Chanodichthys erythropterus]|uniref:uncharacterized protein n=1 Tax=Chanodichthys erythropterus TaxID=933992 RepID=UPI00351F6252
MNTQIRGYCGLVNPDSTSYLNAVLQTLFMTKEFREHVERLDRDGVSSDDNFIRELKKLFNELEKQKEHAVSAAGVVKSLGIDVHKERDAAEYLEKILKKTPGPSELFKITTTKRACVPCRDEHKQPCQDFLSLPVSLKDSPEVEDAVEAHVDQMCEVYQMNCRNCQKTTVWKSEVISFPKLLIIQLRRSGDRKVIIRPQIKVSSLTYELYAIVNHSGSSCGGNYNADIKCEDKIWRRFDDETVSETDLNSIFSEKTPSDKRCTHRSSEAYLLVYRRRE